MSCDYCKGTGRFPGFDAIDCAVCRGTGLTPVPVECPAAGAAEADLPDRVTVVLERDPESPGWWVVRSPEFGDLLTQGRTFPEALAMAGDAAGCLLDDDAGADALFAPELGEAGA